MDNLSDAYYLIQLIARQILIFLRDFIFREFTWFAPMEDFDNANSQIRGAPSQDAAADFFVFFTVCGLLFAFMILSANSPKNEVSNYDTSNIEAISMAFKEDLSSYWYSRSVSSDLINCHHACGDSISLPCNIIPKMQSILRPTIAKSRMSSRSKNLNYSVRPGYSHQTQTGRRASQTTSREWLIRRTRSGHVYGKYPI
ncbi:uncharacterized protein [Linepithema humile]|uniref:uncharacterized protein n=1 Tax=Linepithema humile TaxID=83485 RepID=UPI0006236DF7|nr:PREDICTED: uncharacterized protein LOC105670339 [Linepithema humile]